MRVSLRYKLEKLNQLPCETRHSLMGLNWLRRFVLGFGSDLC